MKRYDRNYFDHWYRQHGTGHRQRLMRKVSLAVATAEYYLERPIRTVLDIGCGEGAWRGLLLKLRPKLQYLGFDNSEYVIRRFGPRRNLYHANFADFAQLRPCAPVDLLICADVLHYLPTVELELGLSGLAELCAGVAFLETFTCDDDFDGDKEGFQSRSATWYRNRFHKAGLTGVGSHCWLAPALADAPTTLESAAATKRTHPHADTSL